MTHLKFVNRIAERYIEIYSKGGYVAALEYAKRMVEEDEELKKAVRNRIKTLMPVGDSDGTA